MLDLKFAPPSVDLQDSGCCDICGFTALQGFKSYREGTKEAILCVPCFYTNHACSAPVEDFSLIWLPEISQSDLINLSRVITMVIYQNKDLQKSFGSAKTAKIYNNSMKLLRTLALRVNYTAETIREIARALEETKKSVILSYKGSALRSTDNLPVLVLHEILSDHSSNTRKQVLGAMKLLPRRFDLEQVDEWINSNGSLSGYGIDTIINSDWFIANTGLSKNIINSFKRDR